MVCTSQEKRTGSYSPGENKKLDPTHQEKEKKKEEKTGSYSPGERGPGAGPLGAGAVIIS